MSDLDREIEATFNPPDDRMIVDRWVELLPHAYMLAKAERAHQLRGNRVSGFDGRGLHTFSMVCGQLECCEVLAGLNVLEGVCPSPQDFRRAGREDAEAEFKARVLEEAA